MAYEDREDTIIALSTAAGQAAIAVIRLSGELAISAVNMFFSGKDLSKAASHTAHFGSIRENGETIDEVVVTVFKAPNSFTKENVTEISCHGSPYIVRRLISLFLQQEGVRYARAGEFTKRAFLNGRFDLAQAEAVADLISAETAAAHEAAIQQMRGGFSDEIRVLRSQLVDFTSLIELELDFSEEDVEFADRSQLSELLQKIGSRLTALISSFRLGNVIKNGVPTVIAGRPNAGKSTLLNKLLNEEKAIVSDIAGTTRDFIEDEIVIEGIRFRFIDTAGLRETKDKIEALGVERTRQKMQAASLIIYLYDAASSSARELREDRDRLVNVGKPFLIVANKADLKAPAADLQELTDLTISAAEGRQIEELKTLLLQKTEAEASGDQTIVTNIRHLEQLEASLKAVQEVKNALKAQVPGDLLSLDIRTALHHLGEITGEVTNDEILGNIFSKFCIGK